MLLNLTCETCGRSFRGGPRARFCPLCRAERRREQDAAFKCRKREGKVRELGSSDVCVLCGQTYIVTGGNQRYCPVCAPDAVAAVDRLQGLDYYDDRKDEINPARNKERRAARRDLHQCVMCGTYFQGLRGDGCCSPSCRTDKKRLRQAQYDAVRKGKPVPQTPPSPKKIINWSGVDWSKSNKAIAGETGISVHTIWAARKRLHKENYMGTEKKTKGRPKSEVVRVKCSFVLREDVVSRMRQEADRLGQGYSIYIERVLLAHLGIEQSKQ